MKHLPDYMATVKKLLQDILQALTQREERFAQLETEIADLKRDIATLIELVKKSQE